MSSHNYFPRGLTGVSASPPAIIQKAEVKTTAWWKQHLSKLAVEVTTKAKEYRDAVKQFKESPTWRLDFKTWAECSREVLGISKRRANQLVSEITENYIEDDDETVTNSSTTVQVGTPLPIGALQSTTKPALTKEAEALISRSEVRASSEREKPKTTDNQAAPKPPRDETGEIIPQRCLAAWSKRGEVQPWMTMASQLKCFIQDLGQSPSGTYAPLSGHTVSLQKSATELFRWLEICKPYAVCYACQGSGTFTKDRCPVCCGVGLVSRNTWNEDWTIVGMSNIKTKEIERRASLKG